MPTLSKAEKRKREVEDIQAVMSSAEGRRFVRRILSVSGLWKTVFRERPLVMREHWPIFNGAQRDLGQWISDEVMKCAPEKFEQMNFDARAQYVLERIGAQEQPMEETKETEADAEADA